MARTVPVWDPLVRAFHWSLAATIAIAWATGDDLEQVHLVAGYAAVALIGVRLVWGLIGPRHARFTAFVPSPRAVLAYLTNAARGHERRHLGHNPLGGVMIVALLATVLALGLTGWLATTEAGFGTEWLEETHEALANALLLLVVLHVGGVLVASLRHHENLLTAMVTGRKRAPAGSDVT